MVLGSLALPPSFCARSFHRYIVSPLARMLWFSAILFMLAFLYEKTWLFSTAQIA